MPLRFPSPAGVVVEGDEAYHALAASLTTEQKIAMLQLVHGLAATHGFIKLGTQTTLTNLWARVRGTGIEMIGGTHDGSCFWHGCYRNVDESNGNRPGATPEEQRRAREQVERRTRRLAQQQEPIRQMTDLNGRRFIEDLDPDNLPGRDDEGTILCGAAICRSCYPSREAPVDPVDPVDPNDGFDPNNDDQPYPPDVRF